MTTYNDLPYKLNFDHVLNVIPFVTLFLWKVGTQLTCPINDWGIGHPDFATEDFIEQEVNPVIYKYPDEDDMDEDERPYMYQEMVVNTCLLPRRFTNKWD